MLSRQLLDATIVRYITSTLNVILNPVLVIAILGFFGVETTTFAALLAGVGIAIGAAGAVSYPILAPGFLWSYCVHLELETSFARLECPVPLSLLGYLEPR